jgi:hypothetical protein
MPSAHLVFSHRLFGIDLAKCLARIAHRFGDRFEWFNCPAVANGLPDRTMAIIA